MVIERSSGILMHISSLTGAYGIGTFGKESYKFIDFLKLSGQKYWQILPLNPEGIGNSPYSSCSAFAGNPLFIDFKMLEKDGLLKKEDYCDLDFGQDPNRVDYDKLRSTEMKVLRKAYKNSKNKHLEDFKKFKSDNCFWLEDYAKYMAFKELFNKPLQQWDKGIKRRQWSALKKYDKVSIHSKVNFYIFIQYLFNRQWFNLKSYANNNGIKIIGDMPLYVSSDSSDVWSHPELFDVDLNLEATSVSGCPPDDFATEGQLWENPLYKWSYVQDTNFDWLIKRIRRNAELYDVIRIDHFRGLESYYSIPSPSKNAKSGMWIKGPGEAVFDIIKRELANVSIILEDLGFITQEVVRLRNYTGFPGMKVFEFAFSDTLENPNLPHNCPENSIIYIATHDNDTLLGWIRNSSQYVRSFVMEYVEASCENEFLWKCIDKVMESPSKLSIIQMQDFLGLGSEARMNIPGTAKGNWEMRLSDDFMSEDIAQRIYKITTKNNR